MLSTLSSICEEAHKCNAALRWNAWNLAHWKKVFWMLFMSKHILWSSEIIKLETLLGRQRTKNGYCLCIFDSGMPQVWVRPDKTQSHNPTWITIYIYLLMISSCSLFVSFCLSYVFQSASHITLTRTALCVKVDHKSCWVFSLPSQPLYSLYFTSCKVWFSNGAAFVPKPAKVKFLYEWNADFPNKIQATYEAVYGLQRHKMKAACPHGVHTQHASGQLIWTLKYFSLYLSLSGQIVSTS